MDASLTQAPLHDVWPVGQLHTPALQLCPEGHATPQPLQFSGSLFSFTHVPPQLVSPVWQETAHEPPEQTFPAAQAWPHEPQLLLSVCRLSQSPPQLVRPVWHESWHVPVEQT